MEYTITNFFIDYFIKSMPVTVFMFVFLVFSVSKKKDTFQEILVFVVITNLLNYSIINLLYLNDFAEAVLTTLTVAFAVLIYDNTVTGIEIISKSIICLLTIMVIQIVTVYPFIFISDVLFNTKIDIATISDNLPLNTILQSLSAPIQILVLLKLYLIKRRNSHG